MPCSRLTYGDQLAFQKLLAEADQKVDTLDTLVWNAAWSPREPGVRQEQKIWDPHWHHPCREFRDRFLEGRNALARHLGGFCDRAPHAIGYPLVKEPDIPFVSQERPTCVISCPELGHADWQGLAFVLEHIDEGISISEERIWEATRYARCTHGRFWPLDNDRIRSEYLFDPNWKSDMKIERDKWLICRNLLARHLGLRDRDRHELAPHLGYIHEYGMIVRAA